MIYLLIPFLIITNALFLDFGKSKDDSWYSVNDGVMGGRSMGTVSYEEDVLIFEGSVSFENNGGFASVRSSYFSKNLTDWTTVTIRYRSKGQSLSFGLEHYRQWYLPKYNVSLPATDMRWMDVTFNLKDFREYRIGEATGSFIDQTKLAQIIRFGLTTNDKKEGPFRAEIDFIEFK